MVEQTKENPKNEPSAPLLSPKLSYRTRSYVVQIPAFICVISYDTDAGRSMSKCVSSEAGAADQNQRRDEQEQPIVYNEDTQSIKIVNPFAHWHRGWYVQVTFVASTHLTLD